MSVQKQDAPSIKVAIPGVSGTGKSTLFENLIRRENARWVFLYDHKDGDLARRFKVRACFDEEQLLDAVQRGGLVIFNPAKLFPGNREEGFHWFCRYVWLAKSHLRGKKIFGSDELDALVDVHSKPDDLCVILDEGRTFQIECMFICQAMNSMHNQVHKQFTEIFAFRQGSKNAAEWLVEKDCGFFNESELMTLKNGLWLYKNTNNGETQRGGTAFHPKNARRNLRGL